MIRAAPRSVAPARDARSAETASLWGRTREWAHVPFIAIIAVALLLRVYLASTTALIWDEHGEWIQVANSISFSPGALHLPIRDGHHPALPAYFIRFGSMLFGHTELAYRAASLLAGLLTIVVAYQMALVWFGRRAAIWTSLLLAFNEYHIGVSVFAVQLSPYQFFASCAVYAFVQSLRSSRPRLLILAGVLAGLAFLCTEIAVLLVPIALVALVAFGHAPWLRRPEPYLAGLCFLFVISPDVIANFWAPSTNAMARDYGDHLARFGGVGFNWHPLLFWFRDAVEWSFAATGREYEIPVREYPGMNLAFGLLLAWAAVTATWRRGERRVESDFCALLIWAVFGFFTMILPGTARDMDPSSWTWLDLTLVPAALLAGRWLDRVTGWPRTLSRGVVGLGIVISAVGVLVLRFDLKARAFSSEHPAFTGGPSPAIAAVSLVHRAQRTHLMDDAPTTPSTRYTAPLSDEVCCP